MEATERVSVVGPARQSLLALALARLLRRRLDHPDAQRHAERLHDCEIEITAGHMHSTLCFSGGDVTLTCEPALHPRLRIVTSLHALTAIAEPGDLLRSLLSGEIQTRGRLLPMWHLAGVVVPRPPADESLQDSARWRRCVRALRAAFVRLWSVLSSPVSKRSDRPGGVMIPLGPRRSKSRPSRHAS